MEKPVTTVVAAVSVTGAWDGYIRLRCPAATAADIAARMLDLVDVAGGDVDDAMGELINILAGNIKCLLPQPAQFGRPIVGVGADDAIRYPASQQTHHLALRWHDQPVDLSLLASVRH